MASIFGKRQWGVFKLGNWEAENWAEDPLKKQKNKFKEGILMVLDQGPNKKVVLILDSLMDIDTVKAPAKLMKIKYN